MSNQIQRLLVAAIAIPIAIGIVYLGGLPLALTVALLAGLGAAELVALARGEGTQPIRWLAVGASAVCPLSVWALYGGPYIGADFSVFGGAVVVPSTWSLVAGLTLLVLTVTLAARRPTDRPLAAAGITLLVPLYCGALPSFLLGIRYGIGPDRHWPATWAAFFPLAVIWIGDSAAMYAGRAIGGPKLSPVVSPGKTRSGAIAGVVAGGLAGLLYNRLVLEPSGFTLPYWEAGVMGVVLSVAGQVGDLAESLFKRGAGVKDSSRLIPGHGGVLDRLDSLYFVLPVTAMLYRLAGML